MDEGGELILHSSEDGTDLKSEPIDVGRNLMGASRERDRPVCSLSDNKTLFSGTLAKEGGGAEFTLFLAPPFEAVL